MTSFYKPAQLDIFNLITSVIAFVNSKNSEIGYSRKVLVKYVTSLLANQLLVTQEMLLAYTYGVYFVFARGGKEK